MSNEGIRAALDALLSRADTQGIARTVAHRLAVIIDEYCSNLIRHDSSITPDARFEIAVEPVDGGAVLTIRDTARPFDPTADRPRAQRDVGGQGLVLMQGLAADLQYRHEAGWNLFRATVLED